MTSFMKLELQVFLALEPLFLMLQQRFYANYWRAIQWSYPKKNFILTKKNTKSPSMKGFFL